MFDVGRSKAVGGRLGSGKDRGRSRPACDDGCVHILVIEDDDRLAELIARRLRSVGHETELRHDGPSGLARARAGGLDLAIVDVMLPGLDGMALTRSLREQGLDAPVLMLTARDAVGDRVEGLRSGADDYLVKPFSFDELLARIDALARRSSRSVGDGVLELDGVRIDRRARRVHVGAEEVDLTSKEFDLLACLLEHRGQVLTRAQLKELVWDFPFDAKTKVVDLYVHYLRRKLGPSGDIIRTVRGVGYSVGR
jgi:two-component system, OmpR family, response regulator